MVCLSPFRLLQQKTGWVTSKQTFIPHSLEAESPSSGHQHDYEGTRPGHRLLAVSSQQKEQGLSLGSLL